MTSQRPKNYANKGAGLERAVEHSWAMYARRGWGWGQKIATPQKAARRRFKGDQEQRTWRERSTVDFLGVLCGVAVAFDVKECQVPRLDLRRLPEHQRQTLFGFERGGGCAFVLVEFAGEPCFYAATLPWILEAAAGRKSAPLSAFREAVEDCTAGAVAGVVAFDKGGHQVAVPFHLAVEALAVRMAEDNPPEGIAADLGITVDELRENIAAVENGRK